MDNYIKKSVFIGIISLVEGSEKQRYILCVVVEAEKKSFSKPKQVKPKLSFFFKLFVSQPLNVV